MNTKYPGLKRFSSDIGIPGNILIKSFNIEKGFHNKVLKKSDLEKTKELYKEVYNTVHSLYGSLKFPTKQKLKIKLVTRFCNVFDGKTILDVGCGNGELLKAIGIMQF